MSALKLTEIRHGSAEYVAAFALREEVLRKPLGLTLNDVTLRQEREYFHIVCHIEGALAGCLVLLSKDATDIRMRQVAVAPHLQGQGVGSKLVNFAEDFARERGCTRMTLNARDTAIPFYEKLGYARVGEPFEEVTIMHWAMQKSL